MSKWMISIWVVFVACLLCLACSDGSSSPDPTDGDSDGDQVEPDGDGEIPEPDGDEDEPEDGDKETDGDDEGEDPAVNELVLDGIFWLEHGEATIANKKFKEAFEINPDNPQARFGYAFSESMIGFEIIGLMVETASTLTMGQWQEEEPARKSRVSPPPPGDYETWDDWLDKEIYFAFEMIGERFLNSVELYGPLKESGGLSITFEKLPIYIGLTDYTYIKGELDDADVYMFDGMSRTLAAFFKVGSSFHLKSDVATVISTYMTGGLENPDVSSGTGMITYLLNYEPRFLDFRPDGLQSIAEARELLAGALQDVFDATVSAEAELETDTDQTDELFVVDETRDGADFVMQIWVEREDDEDRMREVTLMTPTELQAAATWRTQIMEGGPAVGMDETVIPIISSMAILPISFGLLEAIGVDLGLDPQLLSPSLLGGLISALVDLEPIAIDLHAYFENPKPFRELLPVWTTDKPDYQNEIIMEWECSEDELVDGAPVEGFSCTDEEGIRDLAHFVGTDYEIQPDGYFFATPYAAMQDPTFGGMLYLNIPKLELPPDYNPDPEWQLADQLTFNVILGKVLESVSSLGGGKGE